MPMIGIIKDIYIWYINLLSYLCGINSTHNQMNVDILLNKYLLIGE